MELALLAVVAFAIYGSCLHGEFLFDDGPAILHNADIMHGRYKVFQSLWWRNLTNWTFAMNIRIWSANPDGTVQIVTTFAMHVTNVAIHAVNAYILFHIAQYLGFDWHLSLLAALIFAGHPMAVHAVGNISGRGVLLSTLFALLAVLAVLSGYSLLAIPCFALALMSKEDIVVLPVTIAAIAFILGRSWWWIPVFVPFLLAWPMRHHLKELLANNGEEGMAAIGLDTTAAQPIYSRTAFTETVLRFPEWVIGRALTFDPDIKPSSMPRFFLAIALVLAFLVTLAFAPPVIQIAMVLIAATPLPLYWFFRMPDYVMQYRSYMSITGTAILMALTADYLHWTLITAGVAYLWAWSGFRAFDWCDLMSLWMGCVRDGAGGKLRVMCSIGAAHQLKHEMRPAQEYYLQVLKKNPNVGLAWANLAWIEKDAKNYEGAEGLLRQAVERCPKYKPAWEKLTALYNEMNQPEKAKQCLEGVLP